MAWRICLTEEQRDKEYRELQREEYGQHISADVEKGFTNRNATVDERSPGVEIHGRRRNS